MPDPERPGDPRVDYDVPHAKPWGADMVLYLFFKAVSTGAMLMAVLLWLSGIGGLLTTTIAPLVSIVSISLTALVLILDLERPERFHYILTRSNWHSWMVWGAWFLTAHGALSAMWLIAGWLERDAALAILAGPVAVAAVLATSYTGFLFAQGRARDLWQGPYPVVDLVAQSGAAGAAALLLASFAVGESGADARLTLSAVLAASLILHLAVLLIENVFTSSPTRHHECAVHTIRRGAFAKLFWGVAIAAGGVAPLAFLASGLWTGAATSLIAAAALLALAGSAAWEYIWVEAGQSVPLS
jgi:formate-dependent nitrite reductase membrane component NrfD